MRAPRKTFDRARDLRRDMSLPEVLLWDQLRGKRLAVLRFRRQHALGPFVLDFYCASAKLAVEVDGAQHGHPGHMHSDAGRDAWCARRGILTLRFAATDILDDAAFEGVLATIAHIAEGRIAARRRARSVSPGP